MTDQTLKSRVLSQYGEGAGAPRPTVTLPKKSSRRSRLLRGPRFEGVTIVVPFKFVVPDNAKYGVMRGRMLLRAEYREAKARINQVARHAMHDCAPTESAVSLHVKLYMPDNRRRDATNYAKLLQDAMQGACYVDDTQVRRATYEHAGLDRENPRVEITLTPMETP